MKTEIRAATAADMAIFDGEMAGKSARIIVAVGGEDVLGIAGICRGESGYFAFAKLSETLKQDKRALVRGIRALRPLIARCRAPLFANADLEIEGSDVLLRHIGFEPGADGRPWRFTGGG